MRPGVRRLARRALSTGQPVVIWEDASSTAAARPTGTGLAASPIGLALPEAERFLPGMRTSAPPWRGRGVISECKSRDLQLLVNNYTAPALASALRDREDNLHVCAQLLEARRSHAARAARHLLADPRTPPPPPTAPLLTTLFLQAGKLDELRAVLRPFGRDMIDSARTKRRTFELGDGSGGLGPKQLHQLRRYLQRLPRTVPRLSERRASVVLPLCNVGRRRRVLFSWMTLRPCPLPSTPSSEGRRRREPAIPAARRRAPQLLGRRVLPRRHGRPRARRQRRRGRTARALRGARHPLRRRRRARRAPLRLVRAAPLRAALSLERARARASSPHPHARLAAARARLRSELGAITGVAVTPVVAFIGDLSSDGTLVPPIGGGHHAASARDVTAGTEVFVKETGDVGRAIGAPGPPSRLRRAPESRLRPNPDEVARCFTVPLRLLLDRELWQVTQAAAASYVGAGGDSAPLESSRDGLIGSAPEFMGAPQKIWGLTGYILHRFVADVVGRYRVTDAGQHVPAAFTPGIAVDADDRHEIAPRAAAPG